ncbi:MAG TPA: hypothetical protein VN625_08510, partial [Desulfuromonadaceae bacterium]|nr:hypothetical protein [Desulfuromonadaceae bacterium]
MIFNLVAGGISFVLQFFVLFIVLWLVLKVQKTEYSHVALFGAAAVASALDMIPYYGHYAAVAALLWILHQMMHIDWLHTAPPVIIGYAVKLCFAVWVIGLLLGNLRSNLDTLSNAMAEKKPTNEVSTAASSGSATPPEAEGTDSTAPAGSKPGGYPTNEVPRALIRKAISLFSMKGIMGSQRPAAVVDSGVKTYNIWPGDSIAMQTAFGRVTTHCDGLTNNSVMLHISGFPVTLNLSTNLPVVATPA